MKGIMYLVYGLGLLGLAGTAERRGWMISNVTEVKNVPKSIRDNPGAYRSIYRHYPRYYGGK